MIKNLQSLRAFAALNVVLYHVIGTAATYDQPTSVLSVFAGWGANGVDIFFVISGFVMLHTQLVHKRSFGEFINSRVLRIVPLYWFLTTVAIAIFILVPSAFREAVITPAYAAASYLFLSGSVLGSPPIVYIGWTLEWEMSFYLVFGLGLYFRHWHQSITFTFVILTLVSVITANAIVLEFFGGMLIALAYHRKLIDEKTGCWMFVAGVALLFLSLVDVTLDLQENRVIIWGFPSILIVLGAVTAKQITSKILMFLGNASYSIYLVQMLTIPVLYKLTVFASVDFNEDILALMCLLLTAISGALLYVLIEKPLTISLRRNF